MKKNEVTVAVSEPLEETIKTAIRQQVAVIGEIELRGNFEKLKLGAMVSEAVKQLKLDGEAERGPSAKGGGALGWWNEVCPKDAGGETVIKYRTVMMWKQAAENLPGLIGVKENKREAVVALLAENPEQAVGKDAKILASAEKAANGLTMRQMLLWGGDEPKGKAGRPAGAKVAEFRKDPPEVESARIWNEIKNNLECAVVRDSIEVLEPRIAAIMVGVLTELTKRLNRRASDI